MSLTWAPLTVFCSNCRKLFAIKDFSLEFLRLILGPTPSSEEEFQNKRKTKIVRTFYAVKYTIRAARVAVTFSIFVMKFISDELINNLPLIFGPLTKTL